MLKEKEAHNRCRCVVFHRLNFSDDFCVIVAPTFNRAGQTIRSVEPMWNFNLLDIICLSIDSKTLHSNEAQLRAFLLILLILATFVRRIVFFVQIIVRLPHILCALAWATF